MPWHSLLCSGFISAMTLTAANAAAAACTSDSPAHTVALVELYTSEGCSSCPPADAWLSKLVPQFAANQFVALALHVDYWDYIGWKDPYAQAHFTERQRKLGRLSRSTTIYTPEVFVGMRELRGWHNTKTFERRLQEINQQTARVDIRLSVEAAGKGEIRIKADFRIAKAMRGSDLQSVIVLYEDQLFSHVRRGENRGVSLHHDHVVRYWSSQKLTNVDESQLVGKTIKLHPEWNTSKIGVAAFVEDSQSGEILQVLALPKCAAAIIVVEDYQRQ